MEKPRAQILLGFQNWNLLCSSFCWSFRLLKSDLSPTVLSEGNPRLGFGVRQSVSFSIAAV